MGWDEKHEIYAALFGSHPFMTYFTGWGGGGGRRHPLLIRANQQFVGILDKQKFLLKFY